MGSVRILGLECKGKRQLMLEWASDSFWGASHVAGRHPFGWSPENRVVVRTRMGLR
jgi:hypothetical protein